jgi:hypothetical protein
MRYIDSDPATANTHPSEEHIWSISPMHIGQSMLSFGMIAPWSRRPCFMVLNPRRVSGPCHSLFDARDFYLYFTRLGDTDVVWCVPSGYPFFFYPFFFYPFPFTVYRSNYTNVVWCAPSGYPFFLLTLFLLQFTNHVGVSRARTVPYFLKVFYLL